jgi:glycosyltransferase involved in cell wall biosynthesis
VNAKATDTSSRPAALMESGSDVPRERVLIFIVAYNAERHIESVLARLPETIFNHTHFHLLIIDDSSYDESASRAAAWLQHREVGNAGVLRNPKNLGYGGNQKLGYRYAIDNGFDFVILLHGDGQYDPGLVLEFVEQYRRTNADIVLGSRMHSLQAAAQGGMPFYKMMGNRTLTWFQNYVTGRNLSEYHTGYRGYATDFLSRIPFEINTNDFHFDTEILLQGFYVDAAIAELPIPTHYGDEICHVNGWKYALDVVRATLRYRLHTLGMHCSLKFRNLSSDRYGNKVWVPYSSHAMALDRVRQAHPKTLFDIGCGSGHVARECEKVGVQVTGLDAQKPLPNSMGRFIEWDLERGFPPIDPLHFDMLLMLDVIEHLAFPEDFLLSLRQACGSITEKSTMPVLVLTTPNVAFIGVRLNLLLGRFTYGERGILDITHKRLFTKKSLLSSLDECGYDLIEVKGVGVPFGAVFGGRFGALCGRVANALARLWPSLFAFQILAVCRPRPSVKQLLLSAGTKTLQPMSDQTDA